MKNERMINTNEYIIRTFRVLVLTAIMMIFVALASFISADAADAPSVSVTSVNYDNSTITIRMNSADTMLLMSDKNQKKWEYVPVLKNASDNTVVLDISWISTAKDYVLSFCGDYSTTPVMITIPKQVTNLKASYSTSTGLVKFTNAGTRQVQWKKKDGSTWSNIPASEEAFKEQIYALCGNGASVMFRLAPVNGTSTSAPGLRPSKEVTISITKKSAAPTIKVNDATLSIAVTKGMQYRLADEDGNPLGTGVWTDVTKNENKSLNQIVPAAMYDASTNPVPADTYVQFRTLATSSKQLSNITTIEIPAQEPMGQDVIDGITLEYTSSTTFEIKVLAASSENNYEYCIINQDDIKYGVTIDKIEDVTWKTISSNQAVVIDEDTNDVGDGSRVYVRRKAKNGLGQDDYSLASPYCFLGTVSYPGEVATADGKLFWLQSVAGVCSEDNAEGYITFSLYSPTETTVTKLEFVNYSGKNSYGTVPIKSSVVANADASADADHKYIITTTITSTAGIDQYAKDEDTRKMLAYITFTGSSVFESDASKGIGLYLYPGSKIVNPSNDSDKIKVADQLGWTDYNVDKDYVEYTTAFTRVYSSNKVYNPSDSSLNVDDCDATRFRIKLEMAYINTPNLNSQTPGAFNTDSPVLVEKIKYDGVEFTPGVKGDASAPFYVEYVNTKDDDNKDMRIAVITVNADVIEKNGSIDDRNKSTPVIICLNNGEIIKNSVTMNLRETATINKKPISWSFTEKSLPTANTKTYTDAGGNITTATEKAISYTLNLTTFDEEYEVGVLDVTWNDISVYDDATVSGGQITINLSNAKLNTIDVINSTSFNLVIIFDNGFKITSGCKMTISPSLVN